MTPGEKQDVALMTVETPYGPFVVNAVRDKKMARMFESGRYPTDDVLAIARGFVTPRSTIVDVGAHIGTFTVPLAATGARVVAFEPIPESFALLRRNTERLSVDLRNKGLGREAFGATFSIRSSSNAGANSLMPGGDLPVVPLSVELDHADFIKIDVEGMELEVLEGAAALIELSRPVIFFEVNLSQLRAHEASPRRLEHFFRTRGYRLYQPFLGTQIRLALVRNLELLSALIAPRAWLLGSESAPFDILAVPQERALPFASSGFGIALVRAFINNLADKWRRFKALFSL